MSSSPIRRLRSTWTPIHGPNESPSPKPAVDGVLEVRVRVHEAGEDDRVLEALALARARPPGRPRRSARRRRSRPRRPGSASPSTGTTQSADRTLTAPLPRGRRRTSRCQRLSSSTASQIDPSNRSTSGITSNASETGSTVGRSAAKTSRMTNAIRRFRRSVSVESTRSRTSASTKIGSRKAMPAAEQEERDERVVVARADLDVVELVVVRREEVERARAGRRST